MSGLASTPRGFDSPRLVRAAASQQGQNEEDPQRDGWLLLGGLPAWRVRSDVPHCVATYLTRQMYRLEPLSPLPHWTQRLDVAADLPRRRSRFLASNPLKSPPATMRSKQDSALGGLNGITFPLANEEDDADACRFGFDSKGVRLDPTLANRATSDRAIFRVVTGGTPPAQGQPGGGISTRAK